MNASINHAAIAQWRSLEKLHPAPWYLDRCNNDEVWVKDNQGNTVYYEDLGCIPDEMSTGDAIKVRQTARLLAYFLITFSEHKEHSQLI